MEPAEPDINSTVSKQAGKLCAGFHPAGTTLVEVPEQSWGLWKGLCSTDSTHFAVSMKPMETDVNSAHSTASMQPEESCRGFHSLVIMLKVTKQKPTNS
jgi:hypothetical protein